MSRRFTRAVLTACAKHLREEAAQQRSAGPFNSVGTPTAHKSLTSAHYVSLIGGIATNGRRRNLGSSQIQVLRGAVKQVDDIIADYEHPSSEQAGRMAAEWMTLRNSLMAVLDDLVAPASNFQLTIELPQGRFRWART